MSVGLGLECCVTPGYVGTGSQGMASFPSCRSLHHPSPLELMSAAAGIGGGGAVLSLPPASEVHLVSSRRGGLRDGCPSAMELLANS